ncbi:phasin [Aliidongia dinghuensis]|uniref:Phasin n=1 Tax=Aliidongia dinghuensis TaxID=1867774 RepID=A0A8J3E2F2_9PROT|nr:phasin family protein [Aliidongia dinghuensis]GGF08177.1 phasin [Aliidongia dinghuensis]
MAKLPNPFDTDVTKLMAEFKLPGVDMETVLATQRKNIEALTKANQLAIEGLQTVARRQAEILRAGFEEASSLARELFQNQSPEDRVAKQTEATKAALEKAFSNARELAEIVGKAQQEAFEVINKRLSEGLDEVRELVKKHSK